MGKYAISKIKGCAFLKIKGGVVAPFYTLSFSFSIQTKNITYILPYIYLCFIYLRVVRYTDKHGVFYVHSFVFALSLRFVALCGLIFAFGAFLCRLLFPPQPTHPTPLSRYRIGGYPIP